MDSKLIRCKLRIDKRNTACACFLTLLITLSTQIYSGTEISSSDRYNDLLVANDVIWRATPEVSMPKMPSYSDEVVTHSTQNETVAIDMSHVSEGYLLASSLSNRDAYVILEKDGETQRAYLPTDGRFHVVPITLGDGHYTGRICLRTHEMYFERIIGIEFDVVIAEPLVSFLLPIPIADYNTNTSAVKIARQLYRNTQNNERFIKAVNNWIADSIEYDASLLTEKNGTVYIPDLDRIVAEGTGICSDYASLFAAMLRSCGIPCKIVYGDVTTVEGTYYHAWNLVWLEDKSGRGKWWHYDPTFGNGKTDPAVDYPEPVWLRGNPVYSDNTVVH